MACSVGGRARYQARFTPSVWSSIPMTKRDTPFYGRPKMTEYLGRLGHVINPKRVGRLMRLMGLRGITPRLNTSTPQS
ncbi:transposase [bacterium]|nr:transposase [bacterium]